MSKSLGVAVWFLSLALSGSVAPAAAPIVKPTPEQVAWQDLELGMFIHYGDFTFWGPESRRVDLPFGKIVHPDVFDPSEQNTDQWMEAAKAFGAKYSVLTAKHGSGFCLWPTESYPWYQYSVKGSKWKGGKGDVVKDFVESCRKAGIQPGIYCGVRANWHMHIMENARVAAGKTPVDQAAYAKICEQQLSELWGNYGELCEVWFDGGALPADQGGPDLRKLLDKFQPKAMVFGSPQATIRWVGNEDGFASYPCWATAPSPEPVGSGDANGQYWRPTEVDVPLRGRNWAWQPDQEGSVRSLDNLMEIYYASVGRNCNLLLNLTPDRRGLIPDVDMQRVKEFGAEIQRRFGTSLAETKGQGQAIELVLSKPSYVDHVMLMEQITEGERVRQFVVEGLKGDRWQELCKGSCIGHKFIGRFPPAEVSKVRLRVTESIAEPFIRRFALFQVGPVLPVHSPNNLAFVGNGATPATASSQLNDGIHAPRGINDGMFGNESCWVAHDPSASFQVELAQPAKIGLFKLGRDRKSRFRDREIKALNIEVSLDGQQWKKVAEHNDVLSIPTYDQLNTLVVETASADAKFVKVSVQANGPTEWHWVGIDEFEVYAAPEHPAATLPDFRVEVRK